MSSDITPHQHAVAQADRTALKAHQPACLWFTGLSGSGKSTLANAVELRLHRDFRAHTYLLDGDNIRNGLNRDLGFSLADRAENIRRLGEVARLFVDAGCILVITAMALTQADRKLIETVVDADKLRVIWLGGEPSTDLVPDHIFPAAYPVEQATVEIKRLLQDQGFLYRP